MHLPGLDGIRCIAALAVFVSHAEQTKDWLGRRSFFEPIGHALGEQSVQLFFVLSGFLITYLCFVEQRDAGRIDVGRFYVRRALRIWPMYFALVFVGFLVIPRWVPHASPALSHAAQAMVRAAPSVRDPRFVLYLLLLPQVAYVAWPAVLSLGPLWSIGVEEQFYLFWPLLMRAFGRRPLRLFVSLLAVKLALHEVFMRWPALSRPIVGDELTTFFAGYVSACRFEAMILGAMGAYWAFFHERAVRAFAERAPVHALAWGALPFSIAAHVLVYAKRALPEELMFFPPVWCALLIVVVSHRTRAPIALENRVSNAIGRVSYGFYMIHVPVLMVVWSALESAGLDHGALFYVAALGLTLALAMISYRWFESPFLRLKRRFV